MIDVNAIQGSLVRDKTGGLEGRLGPVSLPWVTLLWHENTQILPRKETLRRGDSRIEEDVEILTLGDGWLPLAWVIGTKSGETVYNKSAGTAPAQAESTDAVQDPDPLEEKVSIHKQKHSPFGPKPGRQHGSAVGQGNKPKGAGAGKKWLCNKDPKVVGMPKDHKNNTGAAPYQQYCKNTETGVFIKVSTSSPMAGMDKGTYNRLYKACRRASSEGGGGATNCFPKWKSAGFPYAAAADLKKAGLKKPKKKKKEPAPPKEKEPKVDVSPKKQDPKPEPKPKSEPKPEPAAVAAAEPKPPEAPTSEPAKNKAKLAPTAVGKVKQIVFDNTGEEVEKGAEKLFKGKTETVSPADMAHLAGVTGVEGSNDVELTFNNDGTLSIAASGPNIDEMERTVSREGNKLVITNESFGKKGGAGGTSARVMYEQMKAAKKLGVDEIRMYAPKGDGYVGFYTWARGGANAKLESATLKAIEKDGYDTAGIKDLHGLMMQPWGADSWKKHGHDFEGTIDLKDPKATEILEKYLTQKKLAKEHAELALLDLMNLGLLTEAKKGKKRRKGKGEEGQPWSKSDEKVWDQVWAEMRKKHWKGA